jgi:pectin methylesterase-like acyl-CoA thioesterase/LysM repeat protein
MAIIVTFTMILTTLSPSGVVYANETQENVSTTTETQENVSTTTETQENDLTTTWNFRGGEEGAYSGSVEGTTDEFEGIVINAETGKCIARENGDTQLNVTTKLCVPVSGSAIIMVNTYPGYHDYSINGVAADSDNYEYSYTGEEGFIEIEAQDTVYLYEISRIYNENTIEESNTDNKEENNTETDTGNQTDPTEVLIPDYNKIDVWDFGGEQLDLGIYNNRLTVDKINSLYPGVTAGSTGVNIASFSVDNGDFIFDDGGKSTTHRLRSTNTELTRYDNKSLNSNNGSGIYSGYIYSNSGSNTGVYLGVNLQKNDILTVCVASNSGNSTINVESPSGNIAQQIYTYESGIAKEMTFYASEDGLHKIYSSDEKLVVARIYREHTSQVLVSGLVVAPEGLTGYGLTFTNRQTGEVTVASVVEGTYSVGLNEKYNYDVALLNANGYIISSSNMIFIPSGIETQNLDVTISATDLVTITGNITGLPIVNLEKLNLKFLSEAIYVPEIVISNDGSFQLTLEKGITYSIQVEGVNDYELTGSYTINALENGTYDFVFEEKMKYPVTISLSGINEDVKNNAVITFMNINEDGYNYSYPLSEESISLRNGQYNIKVTGTGMYDVVMAPTPNVIINESGANANVYFIKISDWNFSLYNSNNFGPGIENIGSEAYYLGLKLSNTGVTENKTYLLLNNGGTIDVPVKAGDVVAVNYCYSAAFMFNDDIATTLDVKSGSTSQIDTVLYTAENDGFVVIKGIQGTNSQTYLTSIVVSTPMTFKDTVTVGATNSDYETINKALDAIRVMNRPSNERVTIEIQPGNYEEMLVIDVPNVTLKNASSNPSTDLRNKGVDIALEAVRITSYYGHGYSYFSMGSDGKYNADILDVNKSNGYHTYNNPGAGSTNGSYWNATVVVLSDGFEANNIIFENSFNQYISEKESNDIVVQIAGSKGERPKTVGDTSVQNKSFVERAAAVAITNNVQNVYFNKCRIVGRQDTLFGGVGSVVAFNKCIVMGGVDYIFGGMTAVFYKCKLVMNTSEESADVAYITAPQQSNSRGYLMYNCSISSAIPGVDTASTKTSKSGYFGRPWQANTSEVVFYKTIINTTDFYGEHKSMIEPLGWVSSLGGESPMMYEYGTMESLKGVDNSGSRASWSTVLTEGVISDNTDISTTDKAISAFLGSWLPFELDATDDTAVIITPQEPETPTTTMSLIADDVTAGTYTSSFEVDGFMITASNDKSVVIDSNSKTADDGTSFNQRIKLGGTGSADNRSIKFNVSGAATVKIYAMSSSSSSDRTLTLYKSDQSSVGSTTAYGTDLIVSTIDITEAGDYYLASPSSGVNVYGVIVTMEGTVTEPERSDWSSVLPPTITSVSQEQDKLVVTFELVTGDDGADKATVSIIDISGNVIESTLVGRDTTTTTRTAEFTPESSGTFAFKVVAERVNESSMKESEVWESVTFKLPLTTPSIKSATNGGNGSVTVTWDSVNEAKGYEVLYKAQGDSDYTIATTVTETSTIINGLTIGLEYFIGVRANRGTDKSDLAEISITVKENSERPWYFSAFGQGVNTTDNYYIGNVNDGSVTVASVNGKGKLVPASTDGLAYYYTTIDANNENFILTANVSVDSWTYSNGQEGFGLMAADAVGTNGDSSVFWNNSYMNSVTKVEYYWDNETQKVSDAGDKITMKLGVGAQEKVGVTADNIADGSIVTNINDLFGSTMATIDTSCASKGAGTYNIVGNYQNAEAPVGTVGLSDQVTTFKLTIQRDNTGYRISYTDEDGNTRTKLYYDISRDALSQIDKDNIYVGFYASRNAKITVTDISLSTSDPATDPPAEAEEVTYVTPSYKIVSTTETGIAEYELAFYANADGVLTIKDGNNNPITTLEPVTANTYAKKKVTLAKGNNKFIVEFTPNEDYKPGENQLLSSYDTVTFDHNVMYKTYEGKVMYVSPTGTASGTGSKSSPLDIYTAVKYVNPGQIIVLAGGTYSLTDTVVVKRGISGTANSKIYLVADPESSSRPVFDFNKASAGFVFAGDYWYMKGFDVTNSADMQKGIQLSGDYCVLDGVNTYYNGNTGIQISRYLSSDSYEDWPAYNLVLNCTSYGNADRGYEDADGFAAKLTIGDGNVFDGCIAYNNADDGWDLFAKIETGPIGIVEIKNSVAYGNGYLPDGTNAGNGNGFKLGGSSITGYHKLINSVSFDNKAKGIDSNSCPDIQVYNCTTFNNGSYNVAFYTNDAVNTDYFADGILSFRTTNKSVGENIKPKGTQDSSKIEGLTNYYWNNTNQTSSNSANVIVTEDWFVNLDTTISITRNSDGTINMNGLLVLTDKASIDAGARMSGTATKVIEIPEDDTEEPEPTPTPTPTPEPTPTPNPPTGTPSQSPVGDNDELDKDEADPKADLNVVISKEEDGTVNWINCILDIKKKINEREEEINNNQDSESKKINIILDMNGVTEVSKQLLQTIRNQNIVLTLKLGNGITWTIDSNVISDDDLNDVDFGINLDTNDIPNKTIDQLLIENDKQIYLNQISLNHEGKFGFPADLTIDFSKTFEKMFNETEKDDKENLETNKFIASIFYHNQKTNTLTLQSSSKVNEEGKVTFRFHHASNYVVVFRDKLFMDEETLKQITVTDMAGETTTETLLYVGGTTGKTKQLVTNLPNSILEAVEKDLIDVVVTHSSNNKQVAKVSKNGKITAVAPGEAILNTHIILGDKEVVFKTLVIVEKAYVYFVKTAEELKVGDKLTFEIAVYGYRTDDIIWKTNKKKISVVGKNKGKTSAVVTGKSVGTEEIHVVLNKKDGKILVKTSINVSDSKQTETKHIIYTVKKGDTLWKIAKEYDCKVSDILKINKIDDADNINVGQKLMIPR